MRGAGNHLRQSVTKPFSARPKAGNKYQGDFCFDRFLTNSVAKLIILGKLLIIEHGAPTGRTG
jgi:hypothetical protein